MNYLKQCQKCMREKPYHEFSRCNRIEGGFLHKCKECERVDRERWKRQTGVLV